MNNLKLAIECTSYTVRHPLDLIAQRSPVVCLQLRVLDSLLAPVLMQPANVILALTEVFQFFLQTLPDEHSPSVLLHNRLFVLYFGVTMSVASSHENHGI